MPSALVYGLNDQLKLLEGQAALDDVALQKALGGGWQDPPRRAAAVWRSDR